MAGCFGNHPFDRAMERQLDRYLDSLDNPVEIEVSKCCECEFKEVGVNKFCYSCGEQCITKTIYKEDE